MGTYAFLTTAFGFVTSANMTCPCEKASVRSCAALPLYAPAFCLNSDRGCANEVYTRCGVGACGSHAAANGKSFARVTRVRGTGALGFGGDPDLALLALALALALTLALWLALVLTSFAPLPSVPAALP